MTIRQEFSKLTIRMKTNEFKSIRALLEMSQDDLAQALGLSRTTISNYETGVHEIPKHIEVAMKGLVCEKEKEDARN